ncbi:diphosphate--fructose-6-phosphate 1-phosphotransferase [Desulforamulus ruminis]|uniref:Pyrophosphate--fructose 6-phosphate 1-phosphotransferase n=1 Tax=Desulforamulus ruminis (strain ATCC 23193 / DSM 2154 / NCIMB 8452 / DL) TaxID=696281 RepID=F6DQR4_DESRL|nr:diphosphate--fructose-6-phosphate 1-phosphotransferase [Desulforamulus ruminis]AEG62061.1 phosphofructokinase [Desulforamulus ruminis DSM 2154]
MQKQNKLFIAQSGGPTAVINSSLAGIIAAAQNSGVIAGIYGLFNGLEGALKEEIVDLTHLSRQEIQLLRHTPAAALGGSRYIMKEEDYRQAVRFLEKQGAGHFLFIGGNGTMGTCHKLKQVAEEMGVAMTVNGVPKTIDNDLVGLDHAPGYASAARYVALAVKAQGADLRSMRTFEQVRIIETMGRAVGWLAAASALAQEHPEDPPHLVYLPEVPLAINDFLEDVQKMYRRHGYVVAVVGEGMKDVNGHPIGCEQFQNEEGTRPVIVGASEHLSKLVKSRLGLVARSQNLGMTQRSFSECVSLFDEEFAYECGRAAFLASMEGKKGRMIWQDGDLPLKKVAGLVQTYPNYFYDMGKKQPTSAFHQWLSPLIGSMPSYFNIHLKD